MFKVLLSCLCVFTPLLAQELPEEFQKQINALEETGGESRFMQEFLYMLFLLGSMVVLLLGGTWFMKRIMLKRWGGSQFKSGIQILDFKQLSQKTGIYVVEIEGVKIALAETHGGITSLGQIRKSFEEVLDPQEKDTPSEPLR